MLFSALRGQVWRAVKNLQAPTYRAMTVAGHGPAPRKLLELEEQRHGRWAWLASYSTWDTHSGLFWG